MKIESYRYILTLVPAISILLYQFYDEQVFAEMVIISSLLAPFLPIARFGLFVKQKRDYINGKFMSSSAIAFQAFTHVATGLGFVIYLSQYTETEILKLGLWFPVVVLFLIGNTYYQHTFYAIGDSTFVIRKQMVYAFLFVSIWIIIIHAYDARTLRLSLYVLLITPLIFYLPKLKANTSVSVEEFHKSHNGTREIVHSLTASVTIFGLTLAIRKYVVSFYDVENINIQILSNIILLIGFLKLVMVSVLKKLERIYVQKMNSANQHRKSVLLSSLVIGFTIYVIPFDEIIRAYLITSIVLVLIPFVTIYAVDFPAQSTITVIVRSGILLLPVATINYFPVFFTLHILILLNIITLSQK